MKMLIQQGRVIDPSQSIDDILDLIIENDKIIYCGPPQPSICVDHIIDARHQWVIPGIVDLCCRPHMQHPQGSTLSQEAKAALACGITTLCIPPDGDPITDTPANTLRIVQQAHSALPTIYPIGALSTQLHGESITDLTALSEAGCIAFSNAQAAVDNRRVLRHCYDYAASFSLPVIIQPCDASLAKGGVAHEGMVASRLGLPGIPEIAETMAIAEHLCLIETTGVRAHFTCLSTAQGVAQIKAAKDKGLPVTADVAMHSLHLTEEAIASFDSHCHLYPPLRTEKDRLGLIEGIQSGVLDAICSDHRPLDSAAKLAPFGDAVPGLCAVDTFLPLGIALVQAKYLTRLDLIRAISTRPASLFNLPGGNLAVGSPATMCIVNPTQSWILHDDTLKSTGKNNPFKNKSLIGKVIKTILRGHLVWSQESHEYSHQQAC